jgi:hypothetical protein
MKKWLALIALVIVVTGIGIMWNLNKSHRNISEEQIVATIDAVQLFNSFQNNEADANKMYLDKTIAVNGVVREMGKNQEGLPYLVLNTEDDFFGVNVYFDDAQATKDIEVDQEISIKGQCTGLALDVTVIHSSLIQ